MAGKPQPATRRSPPPATQAERLAPTSRDAAAADWGVPPKKSGLRGEVKLALMFVVSLGCAFGYIVHRKFSDLRKEVVAAEDEQFKPLLAANDPRNEIELPPADQGEPHFPDVGAQPTVIDGSPLMASAGAPPVLDVQPATAAVPPASSDPFASLASTAPPAAAATSLPSQVPDQFPFAASGEPSELATISSTSEPFFPAGDAANASATEEPPFASASTSLVGDAPPAESSPFPVPTAVASSTEAEPLPFTPSDSPTIAATTATETPLDLFGPLPTTAAAPTSEPTFDPAAATPAAAEPAFAEPSFAPASQPQPLFSPEPLPSRTVEARPAMVEPTWEPTPAAPQETSPARAVAASEPFPTPTQPEPPAYEPLFPETPAPREEASDPFGGPAMPVRPLAVEEQPVPTPSPATLGQPIPTNTEPAWPAANEAPFARTVEPSGPAWPAAAPTLRDGSLFADPPAAANTAFIPDRSPAPTAASSDNLYTVRPGDNYWVIAKAHYGSVRYFAALTEYNRQRVVDPQKMKPGVQVAIPEASVLESQFPHLFTGPVPSVAATRPTVNAEGPGQFFVSAGEPMYRVGQGDTLSSISQKHLGRASRWEQVFAINRDVLPAPDRLKPGLILRLPRDASQIAVTPEGSDGR